MFFTLEGCASARRQQARTEGEKKESVKGGEGEEYTPKLVSAGPRREVPLLSKLPSPSEAKGVGRLAETPEQKHHSMIFYGFFASFTECQVLGTYWCSETFVISSTRIYIYAKDIHVTQ